MQYITIWQYIGFCRKSLSKCNDPKGGYRFSFLLRLYFICDIDFATNECLLKIQCYTLQHSTTQKASSLLYSTKNKAAHC